jgi:hypothetical protein
MRIFYILSICILSNSTIKACVDEWKTVANGNWSTGKIWSINGGLPCTGTPAANACVIINNFVTIPGSSTIENTMTITINSSGTLSVGGDIINNGIITVFGTFNVAGSFTNSGTVINKEGGRCMIGDNFFNAGCTSNIINDGVVDVGNCIINDGTVQGNGGTYWVRNDAKNTSCCASFTGSIRVCDVNAQIVVGCGMVGPDVIQCYLSSLPVTLTYFIGSVESGNVTLIWETASEINSDHYIIERSLDMIAFEAAGLVQAAGNSSSAIQYSFIDRNPYQGISYYRLIAFDKDGTSRIYKSISVKNSFDRDAKIYPLPLKQNSGFTIQSRKIEKGKNLEVVICDITGRKMHSEAFAGSTENEVFVELKNADPGIYISFSLFLKIIYY